MKAVVFHRTGDPDVLALDEVPELPVGRQDIRVTVTAAAVNPVDVKTRSGFLNLNLTYPAVPGWDVSGVVTETGGEVTRFTVGDQVIGMVAQPAHRYGTYAEQVVADARLFARAPGTVPLEEAAALPLGGLTAVQTLAKLTLPPGAPVLVTGAAGAVGRIAVQLLLADGHPVDALARTGDTDALLALGVGTVHTRPEDLPTATHTAVVDTAGVAAAIRTVADGGQFVAIDDNEQPAPERGITPRKSYVEQDGDQLQTLSDLVTAGRLTVPTGRRSPLADAAQAHRDFAAGGLRGKVLLQP
ncbi:NADP-dependent oxidoreductase [Streptomyces caeruleatus]|uniref:Oxidoreductase n=1 Tax=Streptomyces caeruleatus TaxID=661399 RepID=A0A117RH71_9ACTN|nr:NADP-dependent oxidoreductase [Streptomyces caeruleatus]KUN90521.1 oxidoreductase [Streptomyces caeruleatus]